MYPRGAGNEPVSLKVPLHPAQTSICVPHLTGTTLGQ